MTERARNRTPGRRRVSPSAHPAAAGPGRRAAAWASPGPAARRFALLLLALLAAPCHAALAQVFDEFQVFDGRITEPGSFDVNQHLNFGRRGRRGEEENAPRNGLLLTTEIGYATTTWHEIAVYLPVAREFSGDVFGGGFKVRNSFVVPHAGERPIAGGLDIEIRHQSVRFSDANWAMTIRPIFDLRTGPWQLILNPSLEVPFGRYSPVFAPAVRGVLQVAERVWFGLEHYMEFGRIDRWETTARQGHQLFATVDFQLKGSVGLHVGVGHGLTRNSDRWAGKMILSFDF
jgi:hypothetical protein